MSDNLSQMGAWQWDEQAVGMDRANTAMLSCQHLVSLPFTGPNKAWNKILLGRLGEKKQLAQVLESDWYGS